ncbi:MAG: DNA polymerase ligase N-terminal domain-containing protein, partial [Pyrinomonadaceae bacterium]
PKGPPYELGEKRLAMAVEDHPMEYRDFEGIIPKGQYGGGTVMVWDRGTYEIVEGKLEDGKLHLLMNGDKLKGEWALQKWRGEEDNRWLLFKAKERTRPLSKKRDDESVKTGRTMKQIAKDADAVWE